WTILDSLPGTPVLTTATVTRVHGVTATAAQSALTQLTEYGVLETISIGRARRAYVSLDVLDLITRSERAMTSRVFDTAISPPMRAVPVPRRVWHRRATSCSSRSRAVLRDQMSAPHSLLLRQVLRPVRRRPEPFRPLTPTAPAAPRRSPASP